MTILELVQDLGCETRRKAACHGGEYCSPCPFCKEGDDRFLIWPQRHNKNGEYQGGRFTCRVCDKHGDAITFLREIYGIGYREACIKLNVPFKEKSMRSMIQSEYKPKVILEPNDLWKEKMELFVTWCNGNLLNHASTMDHVIKRGITFATIQHFKLGYNPGEYGRDIFREYKDFGLLPEIKSDGKQRKLWLPRGIVIPTLSNGIPIKVKIRRSAWKAGDSFPKYVEVSGSKQIPSIFGDTSLPYAFIVESELDAILVQQEAGDLVYCVALGGSTKPLDAGTDALLRTTPKILFCPDFDEAGAKAWMKWKKWFSNIERILTPFEKSAGDAYLTGMNLREWILNTLTRK